MKQTAPDVGLAVLRGMLAVVFMFHGAQKLFGWFGGYGIAGTGAWMESIGIPFGTLSAVLAGSTELFGGLALLLGVGVRLVAIPMAFTMLVGALTAHTGFDAQTGGAEYPLTLLAVLIGLALLGGGRLTVPHLVRRLRRGEATTPSPTASTAGLAPARS